ncbi:MAG: hypothetical protein ACI865_001841 [Flavobacteriaceae bacterium]|jgi:hypothetical protein
MKFLLLFMFSSLVQFVNFAQTDSLTFQERIPAWANKVLDNSELFGNYTIIDTINPFYFEDDFNGDELIDIVFLVRHKLTGASGTFIINGGKNLCFVMGAGKSIGIGYSIDWCNKWFIFRDKAIYNFSGKKIKTVIRTPGIELRQSEDTSIILYWDRRRYLAAVKSI